MGTYVNTEKDPSQLADAFKSAMGRFAASLTLITTVDDNSSPHGLAATAFSSVSMDPASALVCINRSASAAPVVASSGLFCVNMLQSHHEDICKVFSQPDLRDRRFVDGEWQKSEQGIWYLADAQAAIFCEVAQRVEHGTHTVIIGNVIDVVTSQLEHPLLYMGGRFRELRA